MLSVIVVVVLRELIARPLLNLADLLLVLIGVPADFARRRLRPEQLTTKPTVAIVGGGFSGLWAQRALSDDYDVTIVDFKDYFEYTPGILRCFVEPKALRSLTAALPRRRNKLLRCEVLDVSPSGTLRVRHADGNEASLDFDYSAGAGLSREKWRYSVRS